MKGRICFGYIAARVIASFALIFLMVNAIWLVFQFYGVLPFVKATDMSFSLFLLVSIYGTVGMYFVLIPFCFSLALYIQLRRLSIAHELVALQTSGFSLLRLGTPVICVGAVVFAFLLAIGHFVGPTALRRAEDIKYSLLESASNLQLSPGNFNDFGGKSIYAREVDGKNLKQVFIADAEQKPDSYVILAEQAQYSLQPQKGILQFRLESGEIHKPAHEKWEYSILAFDTLRYDLPLTGGGNSEISSEYFQGSAYRQNIHNISRFQLDSTELLYLSDPKVSEQHQRYYHEFLYRSGSALSCLVLMFFLIPLGVITPRSSGKYDFLKMIAVYLLYLPSFMLIDNLIWAEALPTESLIVYPLALSCIGLVLLLHKSRGTLFGS